MMVPLISYLWLALALYWVVSAARVKRTKETENRGTYALRIIFLVLVFEALFSKWGRIGWFGRRFIAYHSEVMIAAFFIVVTGLGLAAWARHCLGGNWSSAVTLKEGHELIGRGPYRFIRHSIYTGFQVGLLGTALAIGQWRGIVVFVIVVAVQFAKARKEEVWLAREFGAAFEEHRARTGMFLPRIFRAKPRAAQDI
ncbi:MAG: isoprenylcysteine carboxylmethyltransferase family protein [Candidatus Acidiferrales bacterium]